MQDPSDTNPTATNPATKIPTKTRFIFMFKKPVYKDWAFWVWAALAIFILAANIQTIPELFTTSTTSPPTPASPTTTNPTPSDAATTIIALVLATTVIPWVFPSLFWLLPRYIIGRNRNKQIDIVTNRLLYTMPPMTPRRLFMNLPDNTAAKGKTFEHLVKWLLQNDPRFTAIFATPNIYLWADYPNRWGPDNGIDLIATDKTGQTWAIQAKAWDPDRALNKAAIDSFLAESSRKEIQARMVITTAVEQTTQLTQSLAAQEKRVTVVDGDELAKAQVDWESSNLMPLEKYMREQGVKEARAKLGLKPA